MASPQVNGDLPSAVHNSAFLQHLLNYPLISDGIHTFKSNEYGQRSIKLGDSAYKTFAAPILAYLAKPAGYLSPYLNKADTIGDETLSKLDQRFPAVNKSTSELYSETKGLILLPVQKGLEGKDHILQIYTSEFKKNEQQGLVAHGKAAATTVLVVSNETLSWLSNVFQAKKEQTSQIVNDKVNHN